MATQAIDLSAGLVPKQAAPSSIDLSAGLVPKTQGPQQTPEQAAAARLTGGLANTGPAPLPNVNMKTSIAPRLVRGALDAGLPAVGAIAAAPFGGPTVVGNAAAAGVGVAAGDQAAQLAERAIFGGESQPSPASPEGLERTGTAALTAAATAGLMSRLAGMPFTTPKPAPPMQALGPTEQAQEVNDLIGAPKSAVRISKNATQIADAATNPGRTLIDIGLDAPTLKPMTPVERMAAVAPHWRDAGAAIDSAVQGATDQGVTLDLEKNAFQTLKQISDPELQERATSTLTRLTRGLGIDDVRTATPEEGLALKRALASGARFGPNGDLNSLGSVRAALSRAVGDDLETAVPELPKLNQRYSDLRAAMDALQNQTSRSAVSAPSPMPVQGKLPPGMLQKLLESSISRAIGRAVPWFGAGYVTQELARMGIKQLHP